MKLGRSSLLEGGIVVVSCPGGFAESGGSDHPTGSAGTGGRATSTFLGWFKHLRAVMVKSTKILFSRLGSERNTTSVEHMKICNARFL